MLVDFSLPDESSKTEPYKIADFNGDKKEDILVYMGACGTGGCVYGLFLNQFDDYYTLAFMDYLKSPDFEKDENGYLSIKSYEEVEAYDPSKLDVSVFKLEEGIYHFDTSYVYIDKPNE